jgi:hypothetical protein
MKHKAIWIATAAIAVVMGETNAARAWQPPLGILMPPFGINETAPPTPNPWTTPAPGFFYVDATAPSATDSGKSVRDSRPTTVDDPVERAGWRGRRASTLAHTS